MVFTDFDKAFDSVYRDCIWVALRCQGIPDKIIAIIKAKCRVLQKGKLSEPFEVHSGVPQGCILSPLLFLLVVGDVVNAALLSHRNNGLRWTMNRFLQHLVYADDICLLSHKISYIQDMIRSLEKRAASAGLNINCGKTKILSLTGGANRTIEVAVDRFTYLGSVVAAGGGTDMDIENRTNKARSAFFIV